MQCNLLVSCSFQKVLKQTSYLEQNSGTRQNQFIKNVSRVRWFLNKTFRRREEDTATLFPQNTNVEKKLSPDQIKLDLPPLYHNPVPWKYLGHIYIYNIGGGIFRCYFWGIQNFNLHKEFCFKYCDFYFSYTASQKSRRE